MHSLLYMSLTVHVVVLEKMFFLHTATVGATAPLPHTSPCVAQTTSPTSPRVELAVTRPLSEDPTSQRCVAVCNKPVQWRVLVGSGRSSHPKKLIIAGWYKVYTFTSDDVIGEK